MEHMIRRARVADAPDLLRLYAYLSGDDAPQDIAQAKQVLDDMLNREHMHVLVGEEDGRAVSCLSITVIDSLTHGLRPYAVVEHVVTDADYGGRGWAAALLRQAAALAREAGCYKCMLITSRKQEHVHRLYQKAGFHSDGYTAYTQYFT